jgi:hypothetical protein
MHAHEHLTVNRDGVVGIAWYDARNARDRYKREFVCQENNRNVDPTNGVTTFK